MDYCSKRRWLKRLVFLCIGMCMGALGSCIYAKKWDAVIAWSAALAYSVAWRCEISNAELERNDAEYWKNLYQTVLKIKGGV